MDGARAAGRRWWALAAAGAVAAVALQGLAIERQSLTMDEPYHLLAGYQALAHGTNTLNLEHPPLVKLVAALPLLLEGRAFAPPTQADRALAVAPRLFADPALAHRARRAGRALVAVAFALPLLAACYALGREVGGTTTGVTLALLLGLSSAALPFLSLVQTDAAVALAFALTLAAALRFLKTPGAGRAALVGLALGLGLASKFSAVLLLPPVVLALVAARAGGFTRRRRLAAAVAAALGALAVPAVVYMAANLRYDPEAGRQALAAYCDDRGTLIVDRRLEPHLGSFLAAERASPGLAQWLLGFAGVGVQSSIGVYPSYSFGAIRSEGRWWYFPAVLAIKTPLPVLAASLLAVGAWIASRRAVGPGPRHETPAPAHEAPVPAVSGHGGAGGRRFSLSAAPAVLGLGLAAYLAAAMSGSYNLGSRHLLPVLPVLYLPAARWAARSRGRAAVLLCLLLAEAIALAPSWMSATNTWWLGGRNPTRFALGAGDTEYKQNFITLARAAEARGAREMAVLLPGTTREEVAAYLPGGRTVGPGDPLLPGWYAVSVLAEQSLPAILRADPRDLHGYEGFRALAAEWEPVRRAIASGEDRGYAAGSFHLYYRHP